MKRSAFLIGLSMSLLAALAPAHAFDQSEGWVISDKVLSGNRDPGLRIVEKTVTKPDGASSFTISYISINPNEYSARLVLPENPDAGGASLARMFADRRPAAIFTGGFLETLSPATPAGYVQKDRRKLNGLKAADPVLTGIVCFTPTKVGVSVTILPLDKESLTLRQSDCLQVGPLLVLDKQPYGSLEEIDANTRSRNFALREIERSFVARAAGRIIFGVATRASLYDLRELMLRTPQKGGFGAEAATGFSGRHSAGMIVQDKSFGATDVLLPNAIIIE